MLARSRKGLNLGITIACLATLGMAGACAGNSKTKHRQVGLRFELSQDAMNLDGFDIYPIHIGLKLTGPSEVHFKDAVQPGQPISLELPVGNVMVEALALAIAVPQGGSVTSTMCDKTTTSKEAKFYAAVASSPFEVQATTSEVPVVFSSLKNVANQKIGIFVTDDQGAPALGAKIMVIEPLSEKPIIDPCLGVEFYKETASTGKIGFDFPFFAGSALTVSVDHNGRKIPFKLEMANIDPAIVSFGSFRLSMANSMVEKMAGDFNGNGIDDATDFAQGVHPYRVDGGGSGSSTSTSTYTSSPISTSTGTSVVTVTPTPSTSTTTSTSTALGTFSVNGPDIGLTAAGPFSVGWSTSTHAVSYEIAISPTGTCTAPVATGTATTAPYYFANYTTAGTHYICVKAIGADGSALPASNNGMVRVILDTTAPVMPSGLLFDENADNVSDLLDADGTVTMTWSNSDDYVMEQQVTIFSSYMCQPGTELATSPVLAGNVTTWQKTGLSDGYYTFTVTTKDFSGRTNTSYCSHITMASAVNVDTSPLPALASFGGSGAASIVSLSWSFSTDVSNFSQLKIVHAMGATYPTCDTGTVIATIATTSTTSYSHSGATISTTHLYRACLYDALGRVTESTTSVWVP